MDSFYFVEVSLLLGPAIGFVSVARLGPGWRRRLVVTATAWLLVLVAGGLLGFRLAPRPLGAVAVSVGLVAFWIVLWTWRPESDARRWHKAPYWIGMGTALAFNYFVATVGILGVGFATEASRPTARERLTPTVVVYAFRVGGPSIDFNGSEVQVRRTIPFIGLVEHISETRGYARTAPGEMTPPTFTLIDREGSTAILVHLGAWAGDAATSPDTIRLD